MGNVFIRTILLYLTVIIGMRIMGKRQIGQLQPIELVIALMISDVASVALQSTNMPFVYGFIPVITLICCEIIVSFFSMKSSRFRKLAYGAPQIIIRDGKPDIDKMRQLRFNIDDLYECLRVNQVKQIENVKYAILETSGDLSIMLNNMDSPPTASDLKLKIDEDSFIPALIVKDGCVVRSALKNSGLDNNWLQNKLSELSVKDPRELFLLALNGDGSLSAVKYGDS